MTYAQNVADREMMEDQDQCLWRARRPKNIEKEYWRRLLMSFSIPLTECEMTGEVLTLEYNEGRLMQCPQSTETTCSPRRCTDSAQSRHPPEAIAVELGPSGGLGCKRWILSFLQTRACMTDAGHAGINKTQPDDPKLSQGKSTQPSDAGMQDLSELPSDVLHRELGILTTRSSL